MNSTSSFAARLGGFSPIGLLAIIVILFPLFPGWISATFVLLWAWASRTPWRDLGFVRPKSCLRTVVLGVVCGALFKLVMKTHVMPLLGASY